MAMQEMQTGRPADRYLSPAGAWAFSVGTAIGWGSLVVTNRSYLAQAGPLGSVAGLVIGALIMLVISRNYAYLVHAYPEAGGAYAWSRELFGYDHGFVTAWFLALTYLAVLWANATSLPLFARYFVGDVFRVGRLYTLFGYEVYAGEAALSIAATAAAALLCACSKRAVAALMTAMAALFSAGIIGCLAGALLGGGRPGGPAMLPDTDALPQIVKIACISPWAFIGFESISHSAEELSFPRKKILRVMTVSVLTVTALYACVLLLSVTAYPEEYASWLDYIRDLSNLDGLKALPAFYAADRYLGSRGVAVLMAALLSLILTSLLGNITALSRLFAALGRDGILPARFAQTGRRGIPGKAILLILTVSAAVPFFGRTAVGWIVDVTTLGATLIYGFVSAAAAKLAKEAGDRAVRASGLAGLIIAVLFGVYMLVPNLYSAGSMETESFFLFVVWSVLGFLYFRGILRRDGGKRFGRTVIVWIVLLSLVFFVSLIWMSRSVMTATDRGLEAVETYFAQGGQAGGAEAFMDARLEAVRRVSARSILVVIGLFALSLGILLNNYNLMSRRALSSEHQLGLVRDRLDRDPMTGVKSKHAFAEAEQEIDAALRSGTEDGFAIVVCDVNGLKIVNDTLGHKAGDEYIRNAARMICEAFAHSPVFRIGGDEFAAILRGRDYEEREQILETLRKRSEERIGTADAVVSAGMAAYVPAGAPETAADAGGGAADVAGEAAAAATKSLHELFELADARMYEEKQRLKSLGAATR